MEKYESRKRAVKPFDGSGPPDVYYELSRLSLLLTKYA